MAKKDPCSYPDLKHYALKDLVTVIENAKFVVRILENEAVEIRFNKKGRLNILGITGPTRSNGCLLPEVVLAEIGLGRTRPYNKATYNNGKLIITKREKLFYLSGDQYRIVVPVVFQILQGLVNEMDASRKYNTNNPFLISVPSTIYSNKKKGYSFRWRRKPSLLGSRFSVSIHDKLILQFIYAADRLYWKEYLLGLAFLIDKHLKRYRNGSQREFLKLKGGLAVCATIEKQRKRLQPYLFIEMLTTYFPGGMQYQFFNELCVLLNWSGDLC